MLACYDSGGMSKMAGMPRDAVGEWAPASSSPRAFAVARRRVCLVNMHLRESPARECAPPPLEQVLLKHCGLSKPATDARSSRQPCASHPANAHSSTTGTALVRCTRLPASALDSLPGPAWTTAMQHTAVTPPPFPDPNDPHEHLGYMALIGKIVSSTRFRNRHTGSALPSLAGDIPAALLCHKYS